jgi:hypothetical protein
MVWSEFHMEKKKADEERGRLSAFDIFGLGF